MATYCTESRLQFLLSHRTEPECREELGKVLLKLSQAFIDSKFKQYDNHERDEFIQAGAVNAWEYTQKYKPELGGNLFGFLTQAVYFSCQNLARGRKRHTEMLKQKVAEFVEEELAARKRGLR